VKVVVDNNNNALYFSREPIPSPWKGFDNIPKYMQTGIIAFRRKTLIKFNALKETQLEVIESIDMNRILETGGKIRMVMMESETIGVDTAEELIVAERMLDNDNVMGEYIKK
jgi:3-deoxy-manno-octulosonate cytidylyltransferase (CMP-KDO synthetase)